MNPVQDANMPEESIEMGSVAVGELLTSRQGLGCMGMSECYGVPDWDSAISTIRHALDLGVTMLDTADVYGAGHNEVLVGRAVTGRRDQYQIATKFGVDSSGGPDTRVIRGERGYVLRACDRSLTRLATDYIDVLYLHRPPDNVEIEETVGAMSELVDAGKVRFLGLSEVSPALFERAHAIHPISVVQNEYSLWTRNIEESGIVDVMRAVGAALVAYSPLGRGFLTGTVDPEQLAKKDFRSSNPRFTGIAARNNQSIAETVFRLARPLDITAGQLALAWVHHRQEPLRIPIIPIPGTKRIRWLHENTAAANIAVPADVQEQLDSLASQVSGDRYGPSQLTTHDWQA